MKNLFHKKCNTVLVLKMQLTKLLKNKYIEMMLSVDAREKKEKNDCLFLCQPHILITMIMEGKFDCISGNEKDIVFDALQKRYCRSCVRHYCQTLCSIYKFRVFFLNLVR